jgi:outer membrane protein OmpA-like peptidoglycan-associated protein
LISCYGWACAQQGVNLIPNGNFELGVEQFKSDYKLSDNCKPGEYAITKRASFAGNDFKNTHSGDHTSGFGYYLVANSSGIAHQRIWYYEVNIKPNSIYSFEAFFCNVFKLQPPKTNFDFETADIKGNDPHLRVTINGEIIAEEKDFYHVYQWVRIAGNWYSGGHSGTVSIAIENLNTYTYGNDVALDDIRLEFIETMPTAYVPPKHNSMASKHYPHHLQQHRSWLEHKKYVESHDSLGNGVYSMHATKPTTPPPIQTDTANIKVPQRVTMKDLIFIQSKADLLPEAKKQLDLVATWMLQDTTIRVLFIGHTDNVGDAKLNVQLSEDRVKNVKAYLVSKGVSSNRIETIGYGGAYPIADNSREDTRKLNRRVEMEILE